MSRAAPPRLRWVRTPCAQALWCAFWPSDDAANGPIQAWVRQVRRDLFVYGASRPPEPGWPTLAKVGYAPSLDDALSKASDFVEGL